MTDRKQKIKNALDALEGALKYAKHHYEYSKEPVTHGDLIAPILTAMNALCDLQNETPRDWTPCAEALPTKTADYKVTVQVGSEMGTWRETKIIPYRIVDGVGEWILPKSDWLIYGVIAWTKADEPWTGGLDGK